MQGGGGGLSRCIHSPALLRAAQVTAFGCDLDHANLAVAFSGRGRHVDIERLRVGRR